ncbi:hypothetical protein HMI55_003813 [Coelomomyces lativittatus]|nr:hypothetical protein HMI55_003813 [Coelomomyces lativittatus]
MVNKRADLREASIHGGLTLLQLAYTSDLGTSFLYEILNILRRCLQFTQTDLKLMFYIQLASILEDHPGLGIYVIEPLETALAPYLTSSSHISLETCIEESVIKEPVHWLMKCVVMAHHSAFTSMSDPDITSFQTQWTSIATKLHQIDITEKFPIGICFGLSPDCLPHLLRALLYLGCLEALMEFLFLFPNQSLPLLDVLSEKRDLLIRYIQQNYIDAKGRKGTSSSTLQSIFDSAPFFSIPTLVRIIPKHPTLTKSLLTQLSLAVQQHAEYPWTLETAVITSKLLLAALSRDQMELQTERLRQDPKSFRYLFSVLTSFKSIYTQSLQSPWFSNYIQALPSFNHLFQLANDLLLYSLSKEAMLLFQILIQTPLSYIHDQRTLQQQVLALVCSTSLLDTDIIMKPLFQLLFHLSKQMTGMLVFVARNLLYRWGKITNPNASTHSTEEVTDLHLSSKEILDCLESHKSQLQAAFALCEEIEKYIGEIERCLVEFKSEYGKKGTRDVGGQLKLSLFFFFFEWSSYLFFLLFISFAIFFFSFSLKCFFFFKFLLNECK